MNKSQGSANIDLTEQKVVIQMVAFSMIIIVVIFTLASFIRIYSNDKEQTLKIMQYDNMQLKAVMTDHLNYSVFFTNVIVKKIQNSNQDINNIRHILKDQFISREFNDLFGWKEYSWVNHNSIEFAVRSEEPNLPPRHASFIKKTVSNTNRQSNISFYTRSNTNNEGSLKIINSIIDDNTQKYLGSVVLSYDIKTVAQGLNKRKNKPNSHFVVLNKELEIIGQSHPSVTKNLNANIQDALNKLNSTREDPIQEFSHLDMLSGANYFVSPLKGFPFIVIISMNDEEIRQDILDNLIIKFIEVCLFATFSLFIIISFYKREAFLQTKSEKAILIANNATKANNHFLAFTAHEIRSPLGFILTGSEMMTKELMGKLPDEYKQYANGIHGNAKIILDFIKDILDENQIIEGKFKIINSLNNVELIINEIINTNLTSYNNRNIHIISHLEKNLPYLICDKRRIAQIMNNLISNSIKYSEDNTTITITGKIVGDNLEIKIIDQGIGMSEEELPIALSTYGTINNVDYNSTYSYGLGIPIVKMLLEAHDAQINIDSIKGKGTTVTLTFPEYKLIYNDD